MKKIFLFLSVMVIVSCNQEKKFDSFSKDKLRNFDPDIYELRDYNVKLVKGQILYMPIYSNIPHFMDSIKIDMSAFVAFHNTDFKHTIKLKRVQYFDTKGKLVHDFLLNGTRELSPLETVDFYVPYRDQSGTGANFLIEWKSDSLVTEPLVESITINTKMQHCVAVLSQGKVIKELK
ncbi:MAG: DUF3124 domain-containing protein [Bacteroidales bacterium]|nr:MAG: DUF3124 domain-containing protein [Bacteroidales bacterium]